MESPADVVAVLDSDISSVSDSMDSPDPTNVLQTQIDCFTPGVPLCMSVTLMFPLAAVI